MYFKCISEVDVKNDHEMPFIVWSSGPAGQLQRTLDLVFILLFGHYGTFYLRTLDQIQVLKLCKFR